MKQRQSIDYSTWKHAEATNHGYAWKHGALKKELKTGNLKKGVDILDETVSLDEVKDHRSCWSRSKSLIQQFRTF